MKVNTSIILLIISFAYSCTKDNTIFIEPLNDISACGKADPINELDWLNDLAYQALHDRTGNYLGNIWIISYNNSDIIVTNMALGSGGIMYYYFNCEGNKCPDLLTGLDIDDLQSYLTDSTKIFSSIDI